MEPGERSEMSEENEKADRGGTSAEQLKNLTWSKEGRECLGEGRNPVFLRRAVFLLGSRTHLSERGNGTALQPMDS